MSIAEKVDADATKQTGLIDDPQYLEFKESFTVPPGGTLVVNHLLSPSAKTKIRFCGLTAELIFRLFSNQTVHFIEASRLRKYKVTQDYRYILDIMRDVRLMPRIPLGRFFNFLKVFFEDSIYELKGVSLFCVSLEELGITGGVVFAVFRENHKTSYRIEVVEFDKKPIGDGDVFLFSLES